MPLAFKLHFTVSSSAWSYPAVPSRVTRWRRDDSITGWLMTMTTAAGSTASGRTQKKHLEIPHAKEQVGENPQQTPLARLGRGVFCRLEDELAEEKVWLALSLWGTNLSCKFCSAREDLERSLTSDVSDVGKEPAANGDCSALLRPGAPPTTTAAAPTPLCGSRTGGRQFIILSSQGWGMTGLIGTRRGCLLSVSPL